VLLAKLKLEDNERIYVTEKGATAYCPVCCSEVIAVYSELINNDGTPRLKHWRHKKLSECDSWSEGETEWHLKMKMMFPKEWQEITIGKHFADIQTPNGFIIEFQN
jgi:competence CoiA-like predicted nuclease